MANDSSDDEEMADQNGMDKDDGASQRLMKKSTADGDALAQGGTAMETLKKQLNEQECAVYVLSSFLLSQKLLKTFST